MVKSVENGTYLAPFLVKCYEMVNDESTDELISWAESDDSFIIHDEAKFASQLLPKYFKHSKFPSFVRQLNIYGFRKIDSDRLQFANEDFIKGQKHLLKNIKRRKNPQSVAQRNSSQTKEAEPPLLSEEEKRTDLWKEVENLTTDKNALMQELKKLRQHQQTSQSRLLVLGKQLKGMETNQQQMLSFIVMAMQSPEFMVQFFQPKENNWRMSETGKTKLSEVTDDCEPTPNGMIVPYQPPKDMHPVAECTTEAPKVEDTMEFDFSSDEMRDLFMDIDFFDEKLLPLENPTQFVFPEIPENDAMLEQLLWLDPSIDNGLLPEVEFEAHTDSVLSKESDKCSGSDDGDENEGWVDNSEKMEALTKQMEYLKSEISSQH